MMISWSPYVFVRVVLFFISGILLGIYCPGIIPESSFPYIFPTFLIAYAVMFGIERKMLSKLLMTGTTALIAVFLSGYACVLVNTSSRHTENIMHVPARIEKYVVVVVENPQERKNAWRFEADVLSIKDSVWRRVTGKVLLYLSKKDFKVPLAYGDVMVIHGSPDLLKPPPNPGEFDFRRYMQFKGIYHQDILRKNSLAMIGHEPPNKLVDLSIQLRNWSEQTLNKYVDGDREKATLSALVLGVTDGLDAELLNAYAATGTMHALAVSGLHISIIYMIVSLLLKPLAKLTHGKWITAGISLLLLWMYSMVTGLTPSVLRSVVMFSFMAVAKPWNQRTNIYNTLSAAAFCLLVYDPFMVMNVGFQLSFLAVLGIVYLQPMVYSWWEPRSWLLDEIWKVTAVSIAAQMITFPLGLFYFHQFPNYFLLSNLFVIPGSFLILVGGLLLIAVSFITPVAAGVGWLLQWMIKALNGVVFVIESFPFATMAGISITPTQCWILMVIVVLFVLLVVKRQLLFLRLSVVVAIVFSAEQWFDVRESSGRLSLIVYKIQGHTAIDLLRENCVVFYGDSALVRDPDKIKFHVLPARLENHIAMVSDRILDASCALISCNGKYILRIADRNFKWETVGVIPDVIVISNNAFQDFSALPGRFAQARIILDSSNSYYFAEQTAKKARALNLSVFSVLHDGAWSQPLNTSL